MAAHRKEPNTFGGAVVDDARPPQTRAFITSTTALSAIGAGQAEYSLPQDTAARWIFASGGARQMGLEFFGTGADNSTWTANVRGFRRYPWAGARPYAPSLGDKYHDLWRPRPLLTLSGKLGAYSVAADASEKRDPLTASGSTIRGSDDITISADYTFQQTAEADHDDATINNWQTIVFDPMGCELIEVEVRNGSTTSLIGFGFRL